MAAGTGLPPRLNPPVSVGVCRAAVLLLLQRTRRRALRQPLHASSLAGVARGRRELLRAVWLMHGDVSARAGGAQAGAHCSELEL